MIVLFNHGYTGQKVKVIERDFHRHLCLINRDEAIDIKRYTLGLGMTCS
jgi:hypothetical protein